MLQNNPAIRKWREQLRLTPKVFLILFAFVAILVLLRSLQAGTFIFNPILLLPFIVFIGVCGRLFCKILWNTRKSLIRLQERALAGDADLLVAEQPVPNEQALSFPAIIDWRTKNSALVFMIVCVFIVVLAVFLPFLVFFIPDSLLPSTFLQLGIGLSGCLVLILLVERYSTRKRKRRSYTMHKEELRRMEDSDMENEQEETGDKNKIDIATTKGFFAFIGTQLVEVDEIGFSIWTSETRLTIPWNEARLFCIVGGGYGPKSQLFYALASEKDCAKWIDARSQSLWPLTLYRPVLPDSAHQQKMQSFLQVIAGKTGLPLYDLREKNSWFRIRLRSSPTP